MSGKMLEIKAGDIYLDTIFGSQIEITKVEGGFVDYIISKDDYRRVECNLLDEVIEELSDGYNKIA